MEWNQPSYAGGLRTVNGKKLSGEIIQIGAVRMNELLDVEDCFSIDVEPVFYRRMNRNVKKITGITDAQLKGCEHFREAYARFAEFCGDDCTLITWGRDDVPMLKLNMAAHGLDPEGLPANCDLQLIFNDQITHQSRQWSLSAAMEQLGIEQKYEAHNALYDAINTAKIAMRLDMRRGVENYGYIASIKSRLSTRDTFTGFKDLKSARADERLQALSCPVCGKSLGRAAWIGSRGKRSAIAACSEHGALKFALSAYRDGKTFSLVRRVSPASDEAAERYALKLAEAK